MIFFAVCMLLSFFAAMAFRRWTGARRQAVIGLLVAVLVIGYYFFDRI